MAGPKFNQKHLARAQHTHTHTWRQEELLLTGINIVPLSALPFLRPIQTTGTP